MSARVLRMLVLALWLAPASAMAQTPEVRLDLKGAGQRIHIRTQALTPKGSTSAQASAQQADVLLAEDLGFSAVFTVDPAGSPVVPGAEPQALVGGVFTLEGNQVVLHGEVLDFPARKPIMAQDYRGPVTSWRSLVHRFSDDVVLQFTGEAGVANTRMAFVGVKGGEKELYVMDSDGWYARPVTHDRSIAQSPAWSPDGSLLLFTSYRGGSGPRLFVTPAAGGQIYLLSGRPGLNISGVYSPDGREVACSLSQDGNSEVYVLDARGASPQRLTNHRAIDASPSWAPTGREMAFTSDRGGSPQVYLMDRDGGNVRRLTYEMGYTDSPAWSPKGDRIAFVSRGGGGFEIYVCRPDGSDLQLVVTGGSNENPHWSPDGRHLVFASNRDGVRGIYVSDLDQASPRRIPTNGITAMSPAWSPRLGAEAAVTTQQSHGTNPGGSR